jgi:xanthine dehydrogenase iron-sulfur cluster and FAD-binding subunit A
MEALLEATAEQPDALLLAGGTDAMVEINFGHRRPTAVIALRGVAELQHWTADDRAVDLGSAVTYATIEQAPLCDLLPGLAQVARTVGSPQIRNAGTVGGNLATGSPAGDTLPMLLALETMVHLASATGTRQLPVDAFVTGVKRTDLQPGEIIHHVRIPEDRHPQRHGHLGRQRGARRRHRHPRDPMRTGFGVGHAVARPRGRGVDRRADRLERHEGGRRRGRRVRRDGERGGPSDR